MKRVKAEKDFAVEIELAFLLIVAAVVCVIEGVVTFTLWPPSVWENPMDSFVASVIIPIIVWFIVLFSFLFTRYSSRREKVEFVNCRKCGVPMIVTSSNFLELGLCNRCEKKSDLSTENRETD
jgi:hypothetical protein